MIRKIGSKKLNHWINFQNFALALLHDAWDRFYISNQIESDKNCRKI